MKNTTIKKAFAATSLMVAVGYAGMASAHDFAGSLGAGVAPAYWGGQTDVWEVNCPAGEGAHHLSVSIVNTRPSAPPVVSFAAYKSGTPFVVKGETDPKDNDGVYSKEVSINGGSGSYFIIVKKTELVILPTQTAAQKLTKVAAQNYSLSAHCEDINNNHTNIDTQTEDLRQNQ